MKDTNMLKSSEKNKAISKIKLRHKAGLVIFGMILCFIIVELGLRVGSQVFIGLQESRNRKSLQRKTDCIVLCLGESVTAMGGEYSYPRCLEVELNKRIQDKKFSVINKGIPATTSGAIYTQLPKYINQYRPDIVTVMMGINDKTSQIKDDDISNSFFGKKIKRLRIYKLINHLKERLRISLFRVYAIDKRDAKLHTAQTTTSSSASSSKHHQNMELAVHYTNNKNYLKAEQLLEQIIEHDPYNDKAWLQLGWCSMNQGQHDIAKQHFLKTLEINPVNDMAYLGLGGCDRVEGNYTQAESLLRKALEINSKNEGVWLELGWVYKYLKRYEEAEEYMRKSLALNKENVRSYFGLGWLLFVMDRLVEAQEMFEKAIILEPANEEMYTSLASCYMKSREYEKAEQVYKKMLTLNGTKNKAYGGLTLLYEEQGNQSLADEYFKKIDKGGLTSNNKLTQDNYQKVINTLTKNNIAVVCVSYPGQTITPLRNFLKAQGGIIFVDNEQSFKKAISKEGYNKYFIDNFAGDFGHLTAIGGRLIAENIADAIAREYFSDKK